MSSHHPSVCSCPSCKSEECFVKRNTLCACPDSETCALTSLNNGRDPKLSQQTDKNIVGYCTSCDVNPESQNTGNNRNNELIKAINETINQNINKDVRKLLEQFRNSLIEINNKVNGLKQHDHKENKNTVECYSHESYEKTVTEAPKQDGTIFNAPPDEEQCLLKAKNNTTKLNHLIQSAKVMKLDGGIEYRHEHIDRVDSSKKYAEHITKDDIITIKNYSNKKSAVSKDEKKFERIDISLSQKTIDNKSFKSNEKTNTFVKSNDETNPTIKTCTSEQKESNVLTKPWTYMIIEDKSVGNETYNKPSCFILEQRDTSIKPDIKNLDDCACPSDQEQLIVSTQLAESPSSNTKEHHEKTSLPENQDRVIPFSNCNNGPVQESKDHRVCNDLLEQLNQCPVLKQQLTKVIPYTPEQIIHSNILTKPWKYMIIEDDEKNKKPSYYILEQNEDAKIPKIKNLDECACPSDHEQLIVSTQQASKVPNQIKQTENECKSTEKYFPGKSTTNDSCVKEPKDCKCLKNLETYFKTLETQKIEPPEESTVCCGHKTQLGSILINSKDDELQKSTIGKNYHTCNSLTFDVAHQLYRCKCVIDKAQCHANHCCDENEDNCIIEKIRAQADRVRRESTQSLKKLTVTTAQLCASCKKYVQENFINENKCCNDNSNRTQSHYAKLISEDVNPSCDACGTNRNQNNVELTKNITPKLQLCASCKKYTQETSKYEINYNTGIPSNKNTCNVYSLNTQSHNTALVLADAYTSVNVRETNPNENCKDKANCTNAECKTTSTITTTNDTTSYDQIIPKNLTAPSDILKKLKEAYKACNCKVCSCVGSNRCDKPNFKAEKSTNNSEKHGKKKSTTCHCAPCDCVNCKLFIHYSKTIRPNKLAVRGINKQPDPISRDPTKDIIFGLGRNENSCTCLPCDCINCVKLKAEKNRCKCQPCECLQCNANKAKHKNEKSCTCDPCQCTSCSMPREKHTCEDCHNESCKRMTGAVDCDCESNIKDQNANDLTKHVCDPNSNKGYITFAALTDNQPHFLSKKNIPNTCTCETCECLVCDAQFCRLQLRESEFSSKICKCSPCECKVCPSQNNVTFGKQCNCSFCECIACESLPNKSMYNSKILSKVEVTDRQKNMLECYGDTCNCENCVCENCCNSCTKKMGKPKCCSKINFLLPNDNEEANIIQSSTVSQASTSIWSEDQSWCRTTEAHSERSSMPISCIKRFSMDANDIPTKDEPNLFFSPEYDYIQELINYKTKSMTKNFQQQLQTPVRPRLFTPVPFAAKDEEPNRISYNPKLTRLESAKAIHSRKKLFNAGTTSSVHRVGRIAYKKTTSSSPCKSSLNLIDTCDNSIKNYSKGTWIKETDLVLRRLHGNESSNFAGTHLKTPNVQFVKTNDVLMNAKMFSLSLLKILEKYKRANQEFQSVKSKCIEERISHETDIIKLDGCVYDLSILYQKKSDAKLNNLDSNSNELNFKESLNKGGFVLDMRHIKSRSLLLTATSSCDAQKFKKSDVYNMCNHIIQEMLNSLKISISQNIHNLSNVRTVLNLFTERQLSSGSGEQTTENMNKIKYDYKNKDNQKNNLEIRSSYSLFLNKSLRSDTISFESQNKFSDTSNKQATFKIISHNENKQDGNLAKMQNSETLKLGNIKFEPSTEQNDEVDVTVSISTDDMISLRSMESNRVYVIDNNRHPIREFPEVPSLHILKKNARLDETLYPKLSAAYPSMQYDIKNTLHSTPRNNLDETGPSGKRHSANTSKICELDQNVLETTSKGFQQIGSSYHNSSYSHDESLKIFEEESEILPTSNSPLVLKKSTSDKEYSGCQLSVPMTSSSFEDLKAQFLSVMRISNHTIIIKWNKPKKLEGVCGYELLIDGKPVKTNLNPTTCMAVVTCIPQAEKIILTLKTIVKEANDLQQCPTDYTEYHPRINL